MKPVQGVAIGIVKEIDAEHASVKVEYPWFDASYRSNWAPVASPMAGKKRGVFMMPELDDEVLIAFDRSNFDHPFVIGFLWNGADNPSETTNKNRVIITPGGHALRFEDSDNKKKIVLKSSGGHEIVIDDTSSGQTITLKMKNSSTKITLDDKSGGSIMLEGGGRKLQMAQGQVQIS
jgi:uncharacterized protein involved in type VI secretion and phage assembly